MKSRWKVLASASNQSRFFLSLVFCGFVFCLSASSAFAASGSEQPAQAGASRGYAEIIEALNQDFPCMERVTAAIAANNLKAVMREYRAYLRAAKTTRCKVAPPMPAHSKGAAGVWVHQIHTSQEDMEVAIVQDGSAKSFSLKSKLAGKVETSSEGLVLRRSAGQQNVLIGGWGLSSFTSKNLELTTDAPTELLICLRAGPTALMNAGSEPVHVIVKKPFEQRISLLPRNAVELGSQGAVRISDTSIFALHGGWFNGVVSFARRVVEQHRHAGIVRQLFKVAQDLVLGDRVIEWWR